MMDMSNMVNEMIGKDENLKTQLNKATSELTTLLDMVNIRLSKKEMVCHAYTLTVSSPIMGGANFTKH